jgi:short-subunit dehydrogenase involved in D-alanine esterification of teichoic acids
MKQLNNSFQNKIVLITGGSSGIGLALARQLSELGSQVWIVGRQMEKIESALAQFGGPSRVPIAAYQLYGHTY